MNDDRPAGEAPTSPPKVDLSQINGETFENVIPIEVARAHLRHWWREPLAGFMALVVGTFDAWKYGREGGLTGSLDEALVIGGIVLIAGSRRLFSPPPVTKTEKSEKSEK